MPAFVLLTIEQYMIWVVPGIIVLMAFMVILTLILRVGPSYLQARVAGVPVSILQLIGMGLRGVDARLVVNSKIMLAMSDIDVDWDSLEAMCLAGANLTNIVQAVIAAKKAGVELPWDRACAIDLAGCDVLLAVKAADTPIVLQCPHPDSGETSVSSAAKDGVEIKVKAQITARLKLERLVGGAPGPQLAADVAEAIADFIAESETYGELLGNPGAIVDDLLEQGLDEGSSMEIDAIEIVSIERG